MEVKEKENDQDTTVTALTEADKVDSDVLYKDNASYPDMELKDLPVSCPVVPHNKEQSEPADSYCESSMHGKVALSETTPETHCVVVDSAHELKVKMTYDKKTLTFVKKAHASTWIFVLVCGIGLVMTLCGVVTTAVIYKDPANYGAGGKLFGLVVLYLGLVIFGTYSGYYCCIRTRQRGRNVNPS